MSKNGEAELRHLGLSAAEARVYLRLVQNGSAGASTIAAATGFARTSVYQTLCSLTEKGLVEAGAGYASRFSAIPPDQALPRLVTRNRDALLQQSLESEALARAVAKQLTPFTNGAEAAPEELIQVLRNPQVISERFERLQMQAQRQVDIMVKTPILNPRKENPAQQKAQRRGVRFRGLYERAAVEDEEIKPYIDGWIAGGEEARVYDGKLPHKVAIFDSQVVLLPLTVAGDQMRALFIRHQQLAEGLSMLFEFLWQRAEPIARAGATKRMRGADGVDNSAMLGRPKRSPVSRSRSPILARSRHRRLP